MPLTLSSTSTLAEVQAAYDDNCSYDLDGSAEKCRQFIQAARILLRRRAEETANGTSRTRDDYHKIQGELKKAEAWWAANDTTSSSGQGSSVLFPSFQTFRD